MKNSSDPKNQTELAESYGITKQTMNNYMRMANMIPELEDLLETNIRQRGDVGGSAKKVGLRIKELERIYGIKQGGSGFYGNRHTENNIETPNNSETLKTQEQLAKEMGFSVDTLNNYKKLTEMIPELEELVDTGIVTKTTAPSILL